MDITQFFQKKKPQSEKNTYKVDEKKLMTDKYVSVLGTLVNSGVIDMLDYSHAINFMKSGGTIVQMGRYNHIVDKIEKSDSNIKNQFMECNAKLFSHLNDKSLTKITDLIINYNKKDIEFTEDQLKGIKDICGFLCDNDKMTYGLYGFAGTGKTTMIIKLVNFLVLNNYVSSVAFTAPTNKATNIMKSKFRNDVEDILEKKCRKNNLSRTFNDQLDTLEENGLNIHFITIHKLLNYQNDFDVEGERVFIKSGKSDLNKYDIIIVDECSMLSFKILLDIFEDLTHMIKMMGKDNVAKKIPKVLFVGDPAQLPPVKEKISAIFAKNKKELSYETFKKVIQYEDNNTGYKSTEEDKIRFDDLVGNILKQKCTILKKIVRSNDTNVNELCNNIRSWVLGEIEYPEIGRYKGTKVKLYKYDKKEKLNTLWYNNCLKYFKNESLNNRCNIILTWTNRQTDSYNKKAREVLYGKTELKEYEVGDILILNDFYNIKESEVKSKKDDQKKFYTSEQIKIVGIEEVIRVSDPFSESLPIKLRKMPNIRLIEDKFKKTVQMMNKKICRKYNVWKLQVEKLIDDSNVAIKETFQIYVIKKESLSKLQDDQKLTAEKIKGLRNFYRGCLKDQMSIIDKEIIKWLWRERNARFVDPFADVNISFSITTHKSQGSSFYNVFVDAHDIFLNNDANEAKRCIYTAISRTSNEVHILI